MPSERVVSEYARASDAHKTAQRVCMLGSLRRGFVVLGLALAVPALANSPTALGSVHDPDEVVCETAAKLIESALPQRAQRLIVANLASSSHPCLTRTEEAASKAILDAEGKAALAAGEIATDPTEARKLVGDALKIDKENATALTLNSSLPSPARIQRLKDHWDKLVNESLQPLQDLALAFLAVFAALLVLARLAALTPWRWFNTGRGLRIGLWISGLVFAGAASLVLTVGIAEWNGGSSPDGLWWTLAWIGGPLAILVCGLLACALWWPAALPHGGFVLIIAAALIADVLLFAGSGVGGVLLGVLLGILAVGLIACALATRLRLNIEVRNKEGTVNEAAIGQVTALLGELGAEPPSGLEVPRGSDVTALDGTPIAGTPEGRIVKALARVWQLIFGSTPWRVRVDEENEDVHSVVITRNGHTIASIVVDRDLLDLHSPIVTDAGIDPDSAAKTVDRTDPKSPLPDLHRFTAAAVLTTLATHYDGFESLFGVTDWRSLGLHYVATTDYTSNGNQTECEKALAQAINYDPRNIPAQVALQHTKNRDSKDTDVLDGYIAWLRACCNAKDLDKDYGYPLRLRVRMALIATACNRYAIVTNSALDTNSEIDTARSDATRLILDLQENELASACQAEALVTEMKPSAASAYLSICSIAPNGNSIKDVANTWLGRPERFRFSPRGHYNFACLLARDHGALNEVLEKPSKEAVSHLRLAAADPKLLAYMVQDRWLDTLRETDDYRTEFLAEKRTDFLSLSPLSSYADKLRAAGLDSAKQLASVPVWPLSRYLAVDHLVAERLIDLARLAVDVPQLVSAFQVEITDALLMESIDSPRDLADRRSEELATSVANHIEKRCKETLGKEELKELKSWLAPPAPSPKGDEPTDES